MITGDNIYIAVETGVRAGIITKDEKVILLEGRKQKFNGTERIFTGILLYRKDGETFKEEVKLN
jgi:hypothetical protein